MRTRYLLGLGSNRYRHGPPRQMLRRALAALGDEGVAVVARSRIVATPPLGPGTRRYANAAALVETRLDPDALLALLKRLERSFGRRRGRRWGDRALDIDILLWSEGCWASRAVALPHPAFRERRFVLDPLAEIAPDWRDPVTGLTVRQLRHRAMRPIPVDRRVPAA